jgi:hypothetical protein
MSASPFQRRATPKDFGRVVRFEMEHEDGTILRLCGEGAELHVKALNAACSFAAAHGWFPPSYPAKGEIIPPPDGEKEP